MYFATMLIFNLTGFSCAPFPIYLVFLDQRATTVKPLGLCNWKPSCVVTAYAHHRFRQGFHGASLLDSSSLFKTPARSGVGSLDLAPDRTRNLPLTIIRGCTGIAWRVTERD